MKKSNPYVSHDETLKKWLAEDPAHATSMKKAKKERENDPEWKSFIASQKQFKNKRYSKQKSSKQASQV